MASLRSKGLILILSSPSGGGKSTLCKEMLKSDNNLKLSISATTRSPRLTEQEGVHYYFKNEQQFKELIAQNYFLEYTINYDYHYGTPKVFVQKLLNSGIDVIFDIDWQGAQQIKEKTKDNVVSIFILPPSKEILKQRLLARGSDEEETIIKRLKQATEEISHAYEYDYVVINDNFDESLAKIKSILNAERSKTSRLDNLSSYL